MNDSQFVYICVWPWNSNLPFPELFEIHLFRKIDIDFENNKNIKNLWMWSIYWIYRIYSATLHSLEFSNLQFDTLSWQRCLTHKYCIFRKCYEHELLKMYTLIVGGCIFYWEMAHGFGLRQQSRIGGRYIRSKLNFRIFMIRDFLILTFKVL